MVELELPALQSLLGGGALPFLRALHAFRHRLGTVQALGEAAPVALAIVALDLLHAGKGVLLAPGGRDHLGGGRGLGRLLLAGVDVLAAALDVRYLYLHVQPEKKRARGLYAAAGLEAVDTLLMDKLYAPPASSARR